MNDLPYFLALVKKNLILWTIITTGSFAKIDFGNTEHKLSPRAVMLKNYQLSNEDRFDEIIVFTRPFETIITFRDADQKYSKNAKHYFGTDEITGSADISSAHDTSKYNYKLIRLGPIKLNADTGVSIFLSPSEITLRYTSKGYFLARKKRLDSLKKVDSLKD
ncbi:MAG TPA: hypothetical protein VL442_11325 [Mucilaginibacter sp.]|jgi:hypothetical protein|nr:hypothetical protein [Mucilaginibacter sp.]